MSFVIDPPPPVTIPVEGGGAFPVRRVYCVGRNYAAHAREMGADPNREPPFFFAKPADALWSAAIVPYPPATQALHHEIELVVALKGGGADLSHDQALAAIYGYAVGIDLTRRDIQDVAKKAGRPWEMAKGFDASGPIGPLHPAAKIGHTAKGAITLAVNGQPRQKGDLADMIWPVPEMLMQLSSLVRLAAGDLIFTGTPEGVGAVAIGDRLDGKIEGVGALSVTIGAKA